MLYFEVCEEIWGGSPATEPVSGVETAILETPNTPETPVTDDASPISSASDETEVNSRRNLLERSLKNYKSDKLKRKLSNGEESLAVAKADVEVKRQMLAKLDQMNEQSNAEVGRIMGTLDKMAASMEALVKIAGSQLLQQQQPPPNTYMQQHAFHHTQNTPVTQQANYNMPYQPEYEQIG